MDMKTNLLRISDVSKKTTLSKSTIWLKLSQGSFPRPGKLGPSINVWKESDIDSWIASKFEQTKLMEPSNEVL